MNSMTADQAERLALEIRGIADCLLSARETNSTETATSIIFAAENHLLRIAAELET